MTPETETTVYYAQILEPRAGQPTARVLACSLLRTAPNGKIRLKHASTKFGILADPSHTATTPNEAQRLLNTRIGERIEHHVTQIRNLKAALTRHNATPTIVFDHRKNQ